MANCSNSNNKKCYWCKSGTHTAGANECIKQFKENCALNKFIIDFMIGENILPSACAVLSTKSPEGLTRNDILIDEDDTLERNDNIMEQISSFWTVAQIPHRKEIDELKKRITENEERLHSLTSVVGVLKEEVNEKFNEVKSEVSQVRNELGEVKTEMIKITSEMSKENTENFAGVNSALTQILKMLGKKD